RHAARDLDVERLVARMVGEEVLGDLQPLVDGMRVVEADLVHGALQALEVLAAAQHRAVVDGNHLVHAVAEDEPAVEGGDVDLVDGQELTVEVGDGGGHGELKRSLRVSHPRERKPATGTSSRATTGNSASGWRSRVNFIIPAF